MNLIYFILLVIILFIAIRDLQRNKKLPNNSAYNIYQNSRFYRLLVMVTIGILSLIVFIFNQIRIYF